MTTESDWLTTEQLMSRWHCTDKTAIDKALKAGVRHRKNGKYIWYKPDIEEFDFTGKVTKAGVPLEAKIGGDESEAVKAAKEASSIAEERKKEAEAIARAEAVNRGFDPARPVEAWHETVEAKQKELAEWETKLNERESAVEAREAVAGEKEDGFGEREKAVAEMEKDAQSKHDEAVQFANDVKVRAQDWLAGILEEWRSGSVGKLEELLWWATNPTVTRADVKFVCPDCIKDDAKGREATFSPFLADMGLEICIDCEQWSPEREDWIRSLTICDACPVKREILRQVREIAEEIVMAQGGKMYENVDGHMQLCEGVYDENGQYVKGSAFKGKAEVADVASILIQGILRKMEGGKPEGEEDESKQI
jgi:hypothetical protein